MNNPREAAPPGTAATMKARHAPGGMSGKRATTPAKFWSRNKKIVALSAIFGIIIGIGITAAAGSSLYFTYQSQIDPFTASSSVELRNLNVVRDGDTLTATGVLKNTGQTSISRLWIDNLAVSNIEAFQVRDNVQGSPHTPSVTGADPTTSDDDLVLLVKKLDSNTHICIARLVATECGGPTIGSYTIDTDTNNGTTITTRQFDGISLSGHESVLEGGRTQAFKIVISCGDTINDCSAIDISKDVAISDRLTLTFGYASGDDKLVSDAYSARVRSG